MDMEGSIYYDENSPEAAERTETEWQQRRFRGYLEDAPDRYARLDEPAP